MPRPYPDATRCRLLVLDFFQRDAVLARFFFDQLAADFDGALALVNVEPVLDLVARARRLDQAEPVAAGLVAGLREDLDDVAGMQLVAQRHHASVDLGADAGVADFGVNRVSEVDGRGVARQHHDLALGREGVNLFGIEIDLQGGEEFVGIADIALPLDHLPQPCEALLVLRRDRAVFVFPVGGDAFFRHLVHFFGANLDFERRAVFGDHRGVQRLVEVRPRHGDEILDAPGHRPPQIVDDAENGVAILQRTGDDAHGAQVVDLVDGDALALQFLVDAVEALDAAFDARLDAGLFQLVADDLLHLGEKDLALLAARVDRFFDLLVADGIEEAEAEIFEFAANLAHAEAVGDGSVDLQSLFGDLVLAIGRQMLQRAHVVQAIGQLDEHDADVVDHRQHHLAQVFGLLLFARGEVDLADLGDAFDDVGDLLAEFLANVDDRDRCIFDRIVQQAGSDRHRIHLHFGQDEGNFERMDQIRLAGGAGLAFMMLQGVVVGLLDDREIVLRTVFLHPLHQIAELGQRERSSSDLLAQRRHEGLYPANGPGSLLGKAARKAAKLDK